MDLNGLRTEIFIQAVCGSTFKLELKVNWKQHKINTEYIGEKESARVLVTFMWCLARLSTSSF